MCGARSAGRCGAATGYPALLGLRRRSCWAPMDACAATLRRVDGNHYEILTPPAEGRAGKHPLAAMLVLRAMVDFSLRNNRSGRYRHAARHLLECSSLGSAIEDFGRFEPHYAYEARLRREQRRKS